MAEAIRGEMWRTIDALRPGSDTTNPYYGGTVRESLPALFANVGNQASLLSTGVATHVAVPLFAGDVIRGMAVRSGTTAAGTPTNYWFALYDPSLNLVTQTADQTTTAWGSTTTKDLTFQTAVTVAKSGVYYASIMVAATTVPSIVGQDLTTSALSTGIASGMSVLAQTSGSALTTTAPATIASPTATQYRAYVVLHS